MIQIPHGAFGRTWDERYFAMDGIVRLYRVLGVALPGHAQGTQPELVLVIYGRFDVRCPEHPRRLPARGRLVGWQ